MLKRRWLTAKLLIGKLTPSGRDAHMRDGWLPFPQGNPSPGFRVCWKGVRFEAKEFVPSFCVLPTNTLVLTTAQSPSTTAERS